MSEVQPQTTKQSRVGKRPVAVPAGVQVQVAGSSFTVKGPKGEAKRTFPAAIKIEQKDGGVIVSPNPGSGRDGLQFQGMARAVIQNMLDGVAKGFNKSLDLRGVGYRAEVKGESLTVAVGLSHTVTLDVPKSVKARVEIIDEAGTKYPRLHLESFDKEQLGQFAARIRSVRPPEPYKGKGVRYTGEKIREKAGKAGKAGK